MTRYHVILWTGRLLALVYTVALIYDVFGDGNLSREIRLTTIGIVAFVFVLICGWQARIAWRYEGVPSLPMPFRWVVALWFASLALFVAWNIASALWDGIYSDRRSSFMWWQFGTSTLWFASRWVTVDEPHTASIGETGSSPANANMQ